MISIGSVLPFVGKTHDAVTMEVTPSGGHVGYVHRLDGATGFWAGERALDFLEPLRDRPRFRASGRHLE